jgi:hypothetical protein
MIRSGKRGLLLALLILALLAVLIEARWHVLQRFIASAVYDNIPLTASCAELPTLEALQRLVEEHRATVQAVENIHPGLIFVRVSDAGAACPGKGYLSIEYPSHQDRVRIEELLGPTFYGVPYRGTNF